MTSKSATGKIGIYITCGACQSSDMTLVEDGSEDPIVRCGNPTCGTTVGPIKSIEHFLRDESRTFIYGKKAYLGLELPK